MGSAGDWGGDLLTKRELMVYKRLDMLSIEQHFKAIKGTIFTKRNRAEEELIVGYKTWFVSLFFNQDGRFIKSAHRYRNWLRVLILCIAETIRITHHVIAAMFIGIQTNINHLLTNRKDNESMTSFLWSIYNKADNCFDVHYISVEASRKIACTRPTKTEKSQSYCKNCFRC